MVSKAPRPESLETTMRCGGASPHRSIATAPATLVMRLTCGSSPPELRHLDVEAEPARPEQHHRRALALGQLGHDDHRVPVAIGFAFLEEAWHVDHHGRSHGSPGLGQPLRLVVQVGPGGSRPDEQRRPDERAQHESDAPAGE